MNETLWEISNHCEMEGDEPLILLSPSGAKLWVQIKGFNTLLHKLITICLQDFCITSNAAWRFYQLTYTSWVSIMET